MLSTTSAGGAETVWCAACRGPVGTEQGVMRSKAEHAWPIEKARPLAINKDVELWQLDRKVAVFPSA